MFYAYIRKFTCALLPCKVTLVYHVYTMSVCVSVDLACVEESDILHCGHLDSHCVIFSLVIRNTFSSTWLEKSHAPYSILMDVSLATNTNCK